jgi:hypothetical protein
MNTTKYSNETLKIADLRAELVRDFYEGVQEGWDSYTLDQLSKGIVKLTDMLPDALK